MGDPLFRHQALSHNAEPKYGVALLRKSASLSRFFRVSTAFASAAFVVAAFIPLQQHIVGMGEFKRGAGGTVVFAPSQGVLAQVFVNEGDSVKAGAVVANVSIERVNRLTGSDSVQLRDNLAQRKKLLMDERMLIDAELARLQSTLGVKLHQLRANTNALDSERTLLEARVQISEEALRKYSQYESLGFMSRQQRLQKESELIDQKVRLAEVDRAKSAVAREAVEARDTYSQLRSRLMRDQGNLDRTLSGVAQEENQLALNTVNTVLAPVGGIVTNLDKFVGSQVTSSTPLFEIVPESGANRAVVEFPSHFASAIRAGQEVVLRVSGLPMSRSIQLNGVVTSNPPAVRAAQYAPSVSNSPKQVVKVEVAILEESPLGRQVERIIHSGTRLDVYLVEKTQSLAGLVWDIARGRGGV